MTILLSDSLDFGYVGLWDIVELPLQQARVNVVVLEKVCYRQASPRPEPAIASLERAGFCDPTLRSFIDESQVVFTEQLLGKPGGELLVTCGGDTLNRTERGFGIPVPHELCNEITYVLYYLVLLLLLVGRIPRLLTASASIPVRLVSVPVIYYNDAICVELDETVLNIFRLEHGPSIDAYTERL